MKKFFSVLIIVVLFASLSFAQGYQKGVNNLNIGIGAGLVGVYGDADFPPISVGFQYGYHEKISIGGLLGYSSSSWGSGMYEWGYTYIFVGARGEYHFLEPNNDFDAYGGLTLGYNIVSFDEPAGWREFYGPWWEP
jgi:outer membrane immunogenic protein